jgi:hypothetical protein
VLSLVLVLMALLVLVLATSVVYLLQQVKGVQKNWDWGLS